MKTSKVKFLPAILAASVLTLTSCEKNELDTMQQEATTSQNLSEAPTAQTNDGKYIVVLKDGNAGSESQVEQRMQELLKDKKQGAGMTRFSSALKGFTAELTAKEAEELKKDANVAFIEPDQQIQLHGALDLSTTSAASSTQVLSWGTTKVGYADASTNGRTAWIIDSGIQLNHPDLNVDVARSRSFVTGTTSPDDQFGHGTMVAGILGAKNNTVGVVGIAAGAKLVSLRVMNATGAGSVSSVISALNHVALNGKAGDVVNLSLGAGPSLALDNAVLAVANKGIYVTIAAGNSSANAANYSPARVNHQNVFTISGMRADNTFMGISNWGTPVDYVAPGTGLRSTKIGSTYGSAGGTSMASPHVAGILLLKGRSILTQGNVIGDPDGVADRIVKL